MSFARDHRAKCRLESAVNALDIGRQNGFERCSGHVDGWRDAFYARICDDDIDTAELFNGLRGDSFHSLRISYIGNVYCAHCPNCRSQFVYKFWVKLDGDRTPSTLQNFIYQRAAYPFASARDQNDRTADFKLTRYHE